MKTLEEQMKIWGQEAEQRAEKTMLYGLIASAATQRRWDREIERRERIHLERALAQNDPS